MEAAFRCVLQGVLQQGEAREGDKSRALQQDARSFEDAATSGRQHVRYVQVVYCTDAAFPCVGRILDEGVSRREEWLKGPCQRSRSSRLFTARAQLSFLFPGVFFSKGCARKG